MIYNPKVGDYIKYPLSGSGASFLLALVVSTLNKEYGVEYFGMKAILMQNNKIVDTPIFDHTGFTRTGITYITKEEYLMAVL